MDYRNEMKRLRDTLNEHGYRYYVLDDPTIPSQRTSTICCGSWRIWRRSMRRRSRRIHRRSAWGGRISEQFEPVETLRRRWRVCRMCLSPVEVDEFGARMAGSLGEVAYSVEPKVDGLSGLHWNTATAFSCAARLAATDGWGRM